MYPLREIFFVFLRLGLIAFGGPAAHLGHFHSEFVERRKWVSEQDYADLIALCQFLPGPGSSQVGLSIGLLRAGRPGAFAAWAGFTLPSALALTLLALGLTAFSDSVDPLILGGALTGLKIVAAAVVAKAVWMMWTKLCPDAARSAFALIAAAIVIFGGQIAAPVFIQIGIIALSALAGLALFDKAAKPSTQSAHIKGGTVCLVAFFVLLGALPIAAQIFPNVWTQIMDGFYRSGALVFGGGHVVLPLLEAQTVTPGLIEQDIFLAGYGATQAVPGPLFTFSAFLGGSIAGWGGAVTALIAIYVPSFLLIFGVMPIWQNVSSLPYVRAALTGVNAAVVGLLAAALWNPVITHALFDGPASLSSFSLIYAGFAAIAFFALTKGKTPPWALVLIYALIGAVLGGF